MKISAATLIGFAVMGFIGFFVRLIHIPVNSILLGTYLRNYIARIRLQEFLRLRFVVIIGHLTSFLQFIVPQVNIIPDRNLSVCACSLGSCSCFGNLGLSKISLMIRRKNRISSETSFTGRLNWNHRNFFI